MIVRSKTTYTVQADYDRNEDWQAMEGLPTEEQGRKQLEMWREHLKSVVDTPVTVRLVRFVETLEMEVLP